MKLVNTLEALLDKKAILDLHPMQPGDVETTYADVSALENAIGYSPQTTLKAGLAEFIAWFKAYYEPSLSSSAIS